MFLKISIILSMLRYSIAQNCNQLILDYDDYFRSSISYPLIVNTDISQFSQVYSIGYDIIQFQFSLQYNIEGTVLTAILLESFYNKNEQQICYLIIDKNTYFIQCINRITFQEQDQNLEYSNRTLIQTSNNEICDSIFYDSKFNFTILCVNQDYFQIKSINYDENTQYNSKHYFQQDRDFKLCRRVSIQIEPFTYVIGFLNCSDWAIFRSYNSDIILILDQFILKSNQNSQNLINLVNLQNCQQKVFAIFENGYVKINKLQIQQIIFINKQEQVEIKQLVFDNLCNIKLHVGQEQSLIPYQQYSQDLILSFSKFRAPLYFYQYDWFKIFQYEKELQLFINSKFVQYYNISGFILLKKPFMLAIDFKFNQINFYKIRQISRYLIPKFEYLYEIYLNHFYISDSKYAQCYQILNQNTIIQFQKASFSYEKIFSIDCSFQMKYQFDYDRYNIKMPFYFEVPKEYQKIISIEISQIKFLEICPIQEKILKKSLLLFYNASIGLSVFSNSKFLQFYNCSQGNLFHQENNNDKSVFTYNNKIILLDKTKQLVDIIILQQNKVNKQTIKLDTEILQVHKCYEYLILNLKESFPLILDFSYNLYNQNFSFRNQYQDIQKNEMLLFYLYFYTNQIYQYQDQIIIVQNEEVIKIKFLDYQILAYDSRNIFIALHKIESTLNLFAIEFNEVLLLQNISLFDYSIYKPLTYYSQDRNFIIVVENNNKLFLLVYKKSNQYNLKHIIQISKPEFLYDDIKNHIYYYNEKNDLVYESTNKITLNYIHQDINQLIQIQDFHLNLISHFDIRVQNKLYFKFQILNQCTEILSKQNLLINSSKSPQNPIKIFNHFYGPIQKLYLNNGCSLNLSGPFQIRLPIDSCNDNFQSICHQTKYQQNGRIFIEKFSIIKFRENNNMTNQTDLVIFSKKQNFAQLRNGDFLQVYFYQDRFECFVFKFDFNSDQFIQIKFFQIKLFQIQSGLKSNKLKIIANIINVQAGETQYLIYLNEEIMNYITLNLTNFDIFFIENSQDEYITFNKEKGLLIINHYNISQDLVQTIGVYNFSKSQIHSSNNTFFQMFFKFYTFETFSYHLIKAIKNETSIKINCALKFNDVLFYVTITINTLENTLTLSLNKILRMYYQFDNIILINEYQLIFLKTENICIYDLLQEQQFYEPICQVINDKFVIQVYNNTYFILANLKDSQFFLAQIGYEIKILHKEISQDCLLIAENQISKSEIKIIISSEDSNYNLLKRGMILLFMIITIIVIILLIFLKRRQKLKKHQLSSFSAIK